MALSPFLEQSKDQEKFSLLRMINPPLSKQCGHVLDQLWGYLNGDNVRYTSSSRIILRQNTEAYLSRLVKRHRLKSC